MFGRARCSHLHQRYFPNRPSLYHRDSTSWLSQGTRTWVLPYTEWSANSAQDTAEIFLYPTCELNSAMLATAPSEAPVKENFYSLSQGAAHRKCLATQGMHESCSYFQGEASRDSVMVTQRQ